MKKSNEKNYLEAKNELYLGNFEKAADMFEKLIDEGDARAMFDLGQMYLQGKVHPGDEREEDQFIGRDLIEDAAYNGNVLAQYNMGYYFLKMAKGPSYELDEAERFFKMAENNGYHIPFRIKEAVWKLRNVQPKACTPETLLGIISAHKYGNDKYWYVCKALQESGIEYKDLKTLSEQGNTDALVLSYIGLSTNFRLYRMEDYIDEDDDNCIIPVLLHGTGCNHAIFDESEEELNIVRTALIQSLRSMSKPLTDTYMRVFKDSADLDILHIFADLGYPEAQEELEFIWSLRNYFCHKP